MSRKNKKLKVLFCTESGHINSGYGKYTKSILSRLYATNKYQIAELSCYRTYDIPKTEPWKIYPNAVTKDDDRYQTYIANETNQFGQWRFDIVLADFQPDVVIDFRDIFMSLYEGSSVFRDNFHLVLAPTIDSVPLKHEWIRAIKNCDTLLTHTQWAKEAICQHYNTEAKAIVKDSVDTDIFSPQNTFATRQKLGLPIDAFIIGSVMRNQKRKLIPDLMKVVSKYNKKKPNTYLYLHTSYPETIGWNIPSLLLEYNIQNKVLFSYRCRNCGYWKPMLWQGGGVHTCPKCGNRKFNLCNVNNGLTDEQLSLMYNSLDFYIQYSICEGFGIPPLEAASCGVPFASVKHGAMLDLVENLNGFGIDIAYEFTEQESGSNRVYPSDSNCLSIIEKFDNTSTQEKIKLSKEIRQKVLKNHSWDITAKNFENILDSMTKKKNNWTPIPEEHFDNLQKNIQDTSSNREFIYSIIDKILEAPRLKKEFFVQQMVSALDQGYIIYDKEANPFDRESAVQILQMWLNNKINLNKLMKDTSILTSKDFLEYK